MQMLFIAVLVGFALTRLGERGKIGAGPYRTLRQAMLFAVVGIVMWAAPLGAFGAIAFTVGQHPVRGA